MPAIGSIKSKRRTKKYFLTMVLPCGGAKEQIGDRLASARQGGGTSRGSAPLTGACQAVPDLFFCSPTGQYHGQKVFLRSPLRFDAPDRRHPADRARARATLRLPHLPFPGYHPRLRPRVLV